MGSSQVTLSEWIVDEPVISSDEAELLSREGTAQRVFGVRGDTREGHWSFPANGEVSVPMSIPDFVSRIIKWELSPIAKTNYRFGTIFENLKQNHFLREDGADRGDDFAFVSGCDSVRFTPWFWDSEKIFSHVENPYNPIFGQDNAQIQGTSLHWMDFPNKFLLTVAKIPCRTHGFRHWILLSWQGSTARCRVISFGTEWKSFKSLSPTCFAQCAWITLKKFSYQKSRMAFSMCYCWQTPQICLLPTPPSISKIWKF
jgi:hypothetical protein